MLKRFHGSIAFPFLFGILFVLTTPGAGQEIEMSGVPCPPSGRADSRSDAPWE